MERGDRTATPFFLPSPSAFDGEGPGVRCPCTRISLKFRPPLPDFHNRVACYFSKRLIVSQTPREGVRQSKRNDLDVRCGPAWDFGARAAARRRSGKVGEGVGM